MEENSVVLRALFRQISYINFVNPYEFEKMSKNGRKFTPPRGFFTCFSLPILVS